MIALIDVFVVLIIGIEHAVTDVRLWVSALGHITSTCNARALKHTSSACCGVVVWKAVLKRVLLCHALCLLGKT
jgi:hypothetical protein